MKTNKNNHQSEDLIFFNKEKKLKKKHAKKLIAYNIIVVSSFQDIIMENALLVCDKLTLKHIMYDKAMAKETIEKKVLNNG